MSEILTHGATENSFLQLSVSATATTLGQRKSYPNYFTVIPDDSKQTEVKIAYNKKKTYQVYR